MANLNALPQAIKATHQTPDSELKAKKTKLDSAEDASAFDAKLAEQIEAKKVDANQKASLAGAQKVAKDTKVAASKEEIEKATLASAALNQAQLLQKAMADSKGIGDKGTAEKDQPEKKAELKLVPNANQGKSAAPGTEREKLIQNEILPKDGKNSGVAKAELTPNQQFELAKLQNSMSQSVESQAKVQSGSQAGQGNSSIEQAQAQMAATLASSQAFDQDVEIESVDTKSAGLATLGLKKGLEDVNAQKAPVSKLSTTDYLNLRDVTKKDSISNLNPDHAKPSLDLGTFGKADAKKQKIMAGDGKTALGAAALSQTFQQNTAGKVIDAHTTQGTHGKTVLTHDALNQLTTQVNLLSQAKQDGEIKIRLRPDHLGELQMSVKTQGQNVAIDIRAHSAEAKKIIEESIGSLRASLSDQNLNLSRIDVVSSTNQAQAGDKGLQMDLGSQRQGSGQENASRFADQQQAARQEQLYREPQTPINLNRAREASAQIGRSGLQGLDMIAS